MPPPPPLSLLLLLSTASATPSTSQAFLGKRSSHDAGVVFPREDFVYCASPNNVSIPPLAEEYAARVPGLTLLQVQVVARHGSRVPYIKYTDCWAGYGFTDWNCNVTDMSVPSAQSAGNDGRTAPFIFRKIYDGSPTVLGGTCHLGQLVEEGFEQELANGVALGTAYIGRGRLKLFATEHLGHLKAGHVYLRSDDDPSFRTEMSGEFLLRGMFNTRVETTLLWHTGDFSLDEIAPNHNVCPALSSVEADSWGSREWAEYNESNWVRDLDARMAQELPGYSWEHMLDCLGTTACTGRPFPSTLTHATADDAFAHSSMMRAFKFVWNDAYYSKLGMGPFAKGLLDNIRARAAGDSHLRFGLFLGHDTSVLPLLAAWDVWDGVWPPYAAMLIIELYEADAAKKGGKQKDHFFRLVYRGKELILDGCEGKALCPLSVLEDMTAPWAMATDDPDRPCAVVYEFGDDAEQQQQQQQQEQERTGRAAASSASALSSSSDGGKEGEGKKKAAAAEEGSSNPTTNPTTGETAGGFSVRMLLAVVFSLVVGTLFGVVMTLAWAERRREMGGGMMGEVPPPLEHNIGSGAGCGFFDRLRNRVAGYTSV